MARTRDPDVDDRIHRATIALLERDGIAGLTVNDVAARAGVGKAGIYRRYRSREELIAGAVDATLAVAAPPDGLSGQAALAAIVEDLRVALFESGGLRMLATLLAEEPRHSNLLDLWRRRIVAPRLEIIRRALRDTPAAADPMAIGELALGGLVARHVTRGDVTADAARALAQRLWQLAINHTASTITRQDGAR